MPRNGQNPLKNRPAPSHFPDVLLTVITHLPNEEGYHAKRFEVVRHCLKTLMMTTRTIPILVWDNGSSVDFTEWLYEGYQPDYLTLSPNIGKAAARKAILGMLPPETIVSLSDDDMEYSAGWLDAHLQLLKGFPNVGAVSGFPVRFSFGWGNVSTLKWAQEHATLETGRFIPESYEADYALSIGSTPERIAKVNEKQQDYRVTYNGLQAYAEAQHCQMVGYAGTLAQVATYDAVGVGDEKPFDNAIDAAGLLRLTTIERCTRHMGNVI